METLCNLVRKKELSSGSKGAVCVVAGVVSAVAMMVAIAVAVIVTVVIVVAIVVAVVVVVAAAVAVAVVLARALCDPVSLFKIDEILLLFLINQDLIKRNHRT
ncbi:unnamed protein product [Rhizophagus irregularis]|uniref:Uncharacterized protein n=1 Tax=Rhizophagus irregularis TaxID=588596 RepID=A0A916EGM3_9GLOM|nr:unnamed protein product [Rhizophagus irregularis]